MKRILSLILALTVALSAFTVLAETADDTQFIAGVELENKAELLKVLGILDKKYEITNNNITRGEFASLLIKAKGMQNFINGFSGSAFTDVNEETAYAAEINLAKEMKLISGYSDGTFRPDNNITVFEAAICVIRALGYGVKAEGMGGYPNGYYSVITETKILKNIGKNYNANLTVDGAIELIFNALHTMVMLQTGTEGNDGIYEVSEGETLLKTAFGVNFVDGIVNGVDISNLYGENDLAPKSVYIGDESYYSGEFPMNEMLGYYVRAYYKNEYSHSIIKYAYLDTEKNIEEIISISDITSISNGTVTVENEDGKQVKHTYKTGAPVIYNGANTTEKFSTEIYKDEDGKILSGEITLVDNNGDKKADVIKVDAYREMIVGKYDREFSVVYDYFDPAYKVTLPTIGNEPYVEILDTEGREMSFESLVQGSSLIIYKSKDDAHQDYIKVIASTKNTAGKLEFIETVSGKTFITVADETFELTEYAEENSPSLIIGRNVKVTLNAINKAVRIEYDTVSGDYLYALICSVWKENKYDGSYMMKLMDTQGNISTSTVKSKVKVDGKSYNLTSEIDGEDFMLRLVKASEECGYTRKPSGYCYQLIKYGIDSEGNINYIDTVLDENGKKKTTDLTMTETNELYCNSIAQGEYLATYSMIGEKVILDDSLVVFMVPEEGNESDETRYGVASKSYYKTESKYDIIYFKDSNDDFSVRYVISNFKKSTLSDDYAASIITKVTDVISKDGSKAKKLYVYKRGAQESVVADLSIKSEYIENEIKVSDLKPGDIIHYSKNSDGEMAQYVMMYKYNEDYNKGIVYPAALKNIQNKIAKGHVVSSTPKGIKLIYQGEMGDATELTRDIINATDYTVFNNLLYTITVIDTRNMRPRSGTYMDIIGYNENSDEYSKIIVHARSTSTTAKDRQLIREIYLYK